tara:strand:+ start:4890 stop:6098 length:1209 start_codon:yes stop_codon:yes gene_type:complete
MYQRQAQGLASLGRGPDTELVHMTKNEVNALDNMAKGLGYARLPTNPQTGLPEAGIFDTILPVIAGAGLAMIPGVNALAAGLLVGGATGLATGDVRKGLTAGLGAFGGGSLASGLAGAGAAGGTAAGGGTAGGGALSGTGGALGEQAFQQGIKQTVAPLSSFPNVSSVLSGGTTTGSTVAGGAGTFGGNVSNAFTGLKGLVTNPGATASSFAPTFGVGSAAQPTTTGLLAGKSGLGIAGSAALAPAALAPPQGFKPVGPRSNNYMPYPEGGFMPPERRSVDPFAGEAITPAVSGERLFFDPEPFTSPGFVTAKQGGMLTGRGDGMSDDIMLPIRGAQKGDPNIAAVSTDEFVVPADVVSGLGNGSSSAGAKQLYAMMDRVRNVRTGKESQPRQIKARKMLPA